MSSPLRLVLTDYTDATRWRWTLYDGAGGFLADHAVRLDPTKREYAGFTDLAGWLDYNQPIYPPAQQLDELGRWMGDHVFGGVRAALWERRKSPAVPVHVVVPRQALELLTRPFELARFEDGSGFVDEGVRFIYQVERPAARAAEKEPAERALRILAAFSLPLRASALNLRRERFGLQRLVRELTQTQGLAIELRVLHYGATRDTLGNALEEGEGWDVIHLSGHGECGELVLEDESGGSDSVDAGELGELLEPARSRLKLLVLGACYSGASSHAAARAQVGLGDAPARGEAGVEAVGTVLPSLALALSEKLECAALAMRYPVGDVFATELMISLYGKLLDRRRPLPDALNLALEDALADAAARPPLSMATPILVGPLAAGLKLVPGSLPGLGFDSLPAVGLGIGFPPEPERFVGRMQPMLRASRALAPRSPQRAVLFYGMAGAGKTACALELAYRHEQGRFKGYVWYSAPQEGSDVSTAFFALMQDIQSQLNAPQLGLTATLNDPEQFRRLTLPRLRALLQQNSLLLVLDNLETLLTPAGEWRDPLWGELMAVLVSHEGPSRVVLTSRRPPAGLAANPRVAAEAIHALSFAEGVLLAKELPNLSRLFGDEEGMKLLRETLRVVQGHPKLLEMADGVAADRAALARRLAAFAGELADVSDLLDAFFSEGGAREGETRQDDSGFMRTLQGWTAGALGSLPPPAALLFTFLCRLEPDDRRRSVLDTSWKGFLARLAPEHPAAAAAAAQPDEELQSWISALEALGLVAVERQPPTPMQQAQIERFSAAGDPEGAANRALLLARVEAYNTTYTVHPGVAEAARAAAEPAVLDAADVEVGNSHGGMVLQALKQEMAGAGQLVASSARAAAPYLLRQRRWVEASTLLEHMLVRDGSPDAVAFALPLLTRISDAVAGTDAEQMHAGVLATALTRAGRAGDAQAIERGRIQKAVDRGDFRLAAVASASLVNLLADNGFLQEALATNAEAAEYVRRAGLGPWTQLSRAATHLHLLASMGRYEEVLSEIVPLLKIMEELPPEDPANEIVNPWNVREVLLDAGHTAALRTERWEAALAFNGAIAESMQSRGADAMDLARVRFNAVGPLNGLGRYAEARALLLHCRAIYEAEHHVEGLAKVYAELATLERRTGNPAAAVRFGKLALRDMYLIGSPEGCAINHVNLAGQLQDEGAEPAVCLAHLLASCIILYQTGHGLLASIVRDLGVDGVSAAPPAFAGIVSTVEEVEGVRFQMLFDSLPRKAPDGDAALAEIWRLVQAEQQRARQQAELLALQQQQIAEWVHSIAASVAEASLRAEMDQALATLEQKGWKLRNPVRRLWAGERDAARLTEGLDEQDGAIVRQILQLVNP
ncbi:MAG TPA: NB-ARC domain-containing protein [Longimicrobium sp.]|jgi:hypothetical protein